MELSPLGVSATAGTLRASAGVVLHHQWTEEGVVASPAVNGAQVLHLSVALCVLTDTYREAERLGVRGPVASMSSARIRLVRSAVAELDTAETKAPSSRTRAMIRCRKGAIMEAWGFPLDAYGWYRAALAIDPASLEAAAGEGRVLTLLSGTAPGGE